ncbi:MAG: S8 family serine peptidase [Verrucomicrobiota bacterium]
MRVGLVRILVATLVSGMGPPSGQAEALPLSVESLAGDAPWVSPGLPESGNASLLAKVWFDRQFLGDGTAYRRRAKEFSTIRRRALREQVVAALKASSKASHAAAEARLDTLLGEGTLRDLERHWIVNGFTCTTTVAGIEALKAVPGVQKIFVSPRRKRPDRKADNRGSIPRELAPPGDPLDPEHCKIPWYIRSLLVDKVWSEWGITGKGTLNIIQDNNFLYPPHLSQTVYRAPSELPGNGKDDDGNGLIDDCYGYNFDRSAAQLSVGSGPPGSPASLHGTMCAAIICGAGTRDSPYRFGLAPGSAWAGVIANARLESAVEWAIEHGADTYSMSFSIPRLGELRSHWRKIMEHGSFCGVFFVSGAGNFAETESVPVQMRTPEDIPEVVFAAAGVQRDLSRTPFSSKGPVAWMTEHYREGRVQKPEVCAFNSMLPLLQTDGSVVPAALNGNSFAGPMFCGTIALMLSADPDLLPWDLKKIITSTATDVGPAGLDDETGHGLINAYRAVKEVLRRRALREGRDPARFTGRCAGDELDVAALKKELGTRYLALNRIQPGGAAEKAGLRTGDILREVNGTKIDRMAGFIKVLRENRGRPSEWLIERDGDVLTRSLEAGPPGIGRLRESFSAEVFYPLLRPGK